ncbi:amidohydrolase [Candidatus Laterigemmans baculatus]|uniref:amidohydrolase n=1 Tax=Candidatus Laterigemmans baculatus TaxID=2770505 RepID=UPI0013DBFFC3|nr:amidohydrolase [Candidatus Laterigemmans baculatus]
MFRNRSCLLAVGVVALLAAAAGAASPDLIVHGGKIVTVDEGFTIAEAFAVEGDRIVAVGGNDEILALAGPETRRVDVEGKTVLPGLIDSHVHPTGASMYEFDHPVPEMNSIEEVLDYIRLRTEQVEPGEWIVLSQVFITRLEDQRFPTREELDRVAPKHPVYFRTGPDAAVNSLALEISGIGEDYKITDDGPGYLERDPETGRLTGILRSCTRLVTPRANSRAATELDRRERLRALLADYNSVGITSIADRNASDSAIDLYQQLKDERALTCRVYCYYGVNAQLPIEEVEEKIAEAASHPAHQYDEMLWVRGIKVFLDGGMLTGSAYMREPWGVSSIYSISDPDYRGLLYIPHSRLLRMARAALQNGLQFTAHSVGDGAVHALIDAYAEIDKEFSVRESRPSITHCNFMSPGAIKQMRELGVVADLQPAWLWLDGKTLTRQFGEERLAYFQPYRSLAEAGVIVGGGSDHMQKIGSLRSVNPYNPFLGMWITLKRVPQGADEPLHPEQQTSREHAIRLYTINNAYLTFEEQTKGSIETGKLADFVVLKQDILECPLDEVKDIEVEQTWLGGRNVFEAR